ncbi:MAG TPA: ABC transporter permease [Candidatus Dormibacteraeota bacterium]
MIAADRIWRMFLHEMRMVISNSRLLIAIVGLPLALTLVANLTFNPPTAASDKLGVQDLDNTQLSQKVASQLLKWKGLSTLAIDAGTDPHAYVDSHADTVVVVLPKGLEDSVLKGSAIPLQTFVNRRSQRQDAAATTAVSNAGVEISGVATAVEAARLQAARNRQNEETAAQRAERDALSRFQIGRSRNQTTFVGPANPPTALSRQAQFATVTAMSLLELVALLLAFSMASEHENVRLRRLLFTQLSLPDVIVARALAAWVWLALAMAIVLGLSIAFGMSPGPSVPLLVLISLVVTLSISGYSVLIMGVGYAARQIFQSLGAVLTVGVGAVGGSLLGAGSLPGWIADIGRVTPNLWSSEAYRALLVRGDVGGGLLQPLAVLVGMALVEALLGALLIRRAIRTF